MQPQNHQNPHQDEILEETPYLEEEAPQETPLHSDVKSTQAQATPTKRKIDPKAIAFMTGFMAMGLGILYMTGVIGTEGNPSSMDQALEYVAQDSAVSAAPGAEGGVPEELRTMPSLPTGVPTGTASNADQGASPMPVQATPNPHSVEHATITNDEPSQQPRAHEDGAVMLNQEQLQQMMQSAAERAAAPLRQDMEGMKARLAELEAKYMQLKQEYVGVAQDAKAPVKHAAKPTQDVPRDVAKAPAKRGTTSGGTTSGWSVSSIVGDTAVLVSPQGERHVVHAGDDLGEIKIRAIHGDRGVVSTSLGTIR